MFRLQRPGCIQTADPARQAINLDLWEHHICAARQLAMFAFEPGASARAIDLVNEHGTAARQLIADAIIAAIRSGDLDKAQWWDEVGSHVDALIRDRVSGVS